MCESLVRSERWLPSHMLRIIKKEIHFELKDMQAGVLVLAGESKKEGVRGLEACMWSCQ